VRFAVQPNAGVARQGAVLVAGTTLTVQQLGGAPAACTYDVTPQTTTVPQAGGDVSVEVKTAAGCAWAATTADAFVSVKQGASGTGDGTVILGIAANSGAGRTAAASIAGATVTIAQDGTTPPPPPPPPCVFSVSPAQVSIAATGGTAAITVTMTQGANCAWTAVSQAPFIAFSGGSAGVGSGGVTLSVASNAGSARTGTVTVAGHTVTVSQSAAAAGMVAVISYTSDPGDVVGRGQSNTLTLSASEFTVLLDQSQSELRFNAPQGGNPWLNFTLEVPAGQTLAPGLYERAERWPFQSAGRPGLSVSANSNGCNRVTGRFLISEVTYVGTLIQRLRARIQHHCEGSSPAFRAEVWIDAQGSTTPPPLPQFPPAPSSPTTFLNFQTDPGYIGGPVSLAYNLSNAAFSGWQVTETRQAVRAGLGSLVSSTGSWSLTLSAPNGQQLQVGTYENAARFASASQPGLNFFGTDFFAFSTCDSGTGRFVVLELVYGPQGELERLRATFETKCTGAPAGIRGEVYIVADPWR
jgi:hypothetical protein